MQATERLWWTAGRDRLVPDGHAKAAFLYAAEGDEIPDETAARFGLVDGALPRGKGKKAGTPEADKSGKADEDKSGKADEDKGRKGKPGKGGLTVTPRKKG